MKTCWIFLSLFLCHFSLMLEASINSNTKYPFVLIHGLFGYKGKVAPNAPYWGDVPNILTKDGAIVYEAALSQAHSVKHRGEQLHDLLLALGHQKYHLIGHSFGGLDARYVLNNYPDLIASVTTVSTPNHGSKVADALYERMKEGFIQNAAANIAGTFVSFSFGILSRNIRTQNFKKAVKALTTQQMLKFNQKYPAGVGITDCEVRKEEHEGIPLFSWGSFEVISASDSDFLAYILAKTSEKFYGEEQNDGLVGLSSMKFGKWLGAPFGGHHLVPVGGVIAPMQPLLKDWYESMFLWHARKLKSMDL